MSADNRNSDELLVDRFFQEELSAADQAALAKLLRESPAMQERFRSQMRTEGQLLALAAQRNLEQAESNRVELARESVAPESDPSTVLQRSLVAIASLAAVVLVIFTLGRMSSSTVSAAELFMQIERTSLQHVDRVYQMERIFRQDGTIDRVPGQLSCRGSQAFVAQFPGTVIGGGAEGLWYIFGNGQAVKISDLEQVENEYVRLELGWLRTLQTDPQDRFSLSAAKVLSLVRVHEYEIRLLPDEQSNHGSNLNVLEGRLSTPSELPRTVRIWADEQSREIVRMELDWGPGERPDASDLLTYELVSTERLPDEHFQLETYLTK